MYSSMNEDRSCSGPTSGGPQSERLAPQRREIRPETVDGPGSIDTRESTFSRCGALSSASIRPKERVPDPCIEIMLDPTRS